MDTPTITQYYRESDPARRLALLNMSIEAGEEPELNQIRRELWDCLLYTSPSPRDRQKSRMPSSA